MRVPLVKSSINRELDVRSRPLECSMTPNSFISRQIHLRQRCLDNISALNNNGLTVADILTVDALAQTSGALNIVCNDVSMQKMLRDIITRTSLSRDTANSNAIMVVNRIEGQLIDLASFIDDHFELALKHNFILATELSIPCLSLFSRHGFDRIVSLRLSAALWESKIIIVCKAETHNFLEETIINPLRNIYNSPDLDLFRLLDAAHKNNEKYAEQKEADATASKEFAAIQKENLKLKRDISLLHAGLAVASKRLSGSGG